MKDNKDKKIEFRLTASEKEQIKEAAALRSMTISEFVRYACLRLFT